MVGDSFYNLAQVVDRFDANADITGKGRNVDGHAISILRINVERTVPRGDPRYTMASLLLPPRLLFLKDPSFVLNPRSSVTLPIVSYSLVSHIVVLASLRVASGRREGR